MDRTHLPDRIYDTARRVYDRAGNARFSRRCSWSDARTVMVLPGEPKLVVLDLTCPCGRPAAEHRLLVSGRYSNPPGCTGHRPRQAPRRTYLVRARLRPYGVIYPPVVGWLRGRANRAARRIVDVWGPYCDLDDAPFLLARTVIPPVADVQRAAR